MKVSVAIPCYNEEEVLAFTVETISNYLELLKLKKLFENFEIVLVDDGSSDKTWQLIESFCNQSPLIKGIKLSKNMGHQNALLSGLFNANGDVVVSIDADLQDDITVIEKMILEYNQGSHIVYGVRAKRESDTFFKRVSAEGFYRLMSMMGVNIIFNHADYRLMSKQAIEHLKEFQEVNLFLRGIVPLIGYKSSKVYYERSERFAGESKYPLKKMLSFAWNGITSFSVVPLRIVSILGIFIFGFSFLMTLWVLSIKLFTNTAIPGWASTVLPIYFIGGIQLLSLGIIGEYVGKIYSETKQRPRYFIEKIYTQTKEKKS